jgi:2-polyprenyl-3-methyl-5-hydroxy-6-metoxy-1,4-benzoquinol methylase
MTHGRKIPLTQVSPRQGSRRLANGPLIEDRLSLKKDEREWHDAFYKTHASEAYPCTLEEFQKSFERIDLTPFCEGGWSWWGDLRKRMLDAAGDVRGLRILDYGCGYGKLGMYLASRGAQVWGFDLSSEATTTANHMASQYGLTAQFETMDAEELRYSNNFFDLAIGFGVLHHVIKYSGAGSQLWRVLRPGARAIFHETLWDNPFINLARRFTAENVRAGDTHLKDRDIREFGKEFTLLKLEKRHLLYMLKRLAKLPPFNPGADLQPRPLWSRVKSLDNQILRLPGLDRYCGEVVIVLQK